MKKRPVHPKMIGALNHPTAAACGTEAEDDFLYELLKIPKLMRFQKQ